MEKRIATLTECMKTPGASINVGILEWGMSEEELKVNHPPTRKGKLINSKALIRDCIVEECDAIGKGREAGNVRHLWYTKVISTFTKILKGKNSDSLRVMISQAWGEVVGRGRVKYERMSSFGARGNVKRNQ